MINRDLFKKLANDLYLNFSDEKEYDNLVNEFSSFQEQMKIVDAIDISNCEFTTIPSYKCTRLRKDELTKNYQQSDQIASFLKENNAHIDENGYIVIPQVLDNE